MKKRLSLIVLMLLLTGCNSDFSFSEISIGNANDAVQEFIEYAEVKNGNYLYLDGEKNMYVFINGIYVNQGNDAVYFSDFNVSAQQDTLNVFINQEYDSDYSNTKLKYQVLYKIKTVEKYDTINLFINGKPVSFDEIFGNEQLIVYEM
ncbi:lipoprotein [Sporosarcina sp. FSL K6-1540]|uniref:lipoprotein n=1 Tax=Sporosarcina sp. FSL K6-1540 TaxID=2921555 RepID=UPI00315B15AD